MTAFMIALASTSLPLALPPRFDAGVRLELSRSRCKPYFRRMSSGSAAAGGSAESQPCYQLAAHRAVANFL